jgi:hypothetical protein
MRQRTTTGSKRSRIVWDNLKQWVRGKVQEFIQSLLEEEIMELLGRKKSERRKAVDSPAGIIEFSMVAVKHGKTSPIGSILSTNSRKNQPTPSLAVRKRKVNLKAIR